ncbi:hypothetical protein HAX54_043406 [Datura stramonium]|uniref:Uncharacterized protein n=1 Tax=Datura stramonium TaxID=4076 RepID=A0ABS8SPF3_DATST|nr:hypothetical protein [Datura stramonium]
MHWTPSIQYMSNPNHSQPSSSATSCSCSDAAEFTCTLCLLCGCCPLSILCCCVKTPYKIVKQVKYKVCCGLEKKVLPGYSSFSDKDTDSSNKPAGRPSKKMKKLLLSKN